MAQVTVPRIPGPGGSTPKGLFGLAGLAALVALAFILYHVSRFYTVGEYERTVVTRFGQFSSLAGPGLHFRIRVALQCIADPARDCQALVR